MSVSEKVAYLKGLADGLELGKEPSREGKLISVIIEILEEVGLNLEDLEDSVDTLTDGLDVVSEDLEDLENLCYGDDEDDDCGCGCGNDDEDDEDFFEIVCPNCEEEVVVNEGTLLMGTVNCPNCGKEISLGLDDEDDEDD